jgi:hypothetical protein
MELIQQKWLLELHNVPLHHHRVNLIDLMNVCKNSCVYKIFYKIIIVVLEIEERKQFLDQMTALGKRREYQQVISNEIADVSILKIT